jgi:tetratricopeptide (TPR) repeat protein
MPLAIELAAARVRMMTVGQLVERMRERFRLLGGPGSGRHASLKATIEGSWELMREWEKAAWAQCAVFEGGFTLEAAEEVVDLGAWPEAPWVVDVVQSLVDKSLLRTWVPEMGPRGGMPEARIGMYVSLQEYARLKLREEDAVAGGGSGAQAERAAEVRHGNWYARYGTEKAIAELDRDGVERRRRLERELENLAAACRRAVGRGDGETAAAAYQAFWKGIELRGPFGVAVEVGREVLGDPRLGQEARANVLLALGKAERLSGRMEEARGHCEAALAIHREMGNRRLEGLVLGNLSNIHREQGRMEEAHTQGEAALGIHREVGDRWSEAVVLGFLGNIHREQGRIEEARSHYEAALAVHRELGDRRLEGYVITNLATLDHEQVRLPVARGNYEAALIIARQVGDRRLEGIVLANLAVLEQDQGRTEEALAQLEAVLAIHRELGDRRSEGIILGHLGNLHRDQGRLEEALGHYEAALAINREVGDRRSEGSVLGTLGHLLHRQGRIDQALDALTRGEAILRQIGEPIELAKLLCVRAELEQGRGNMAAARTAASEAEALAAQVGLGPDSELGRMVAKLREALPP